MTIQSSLFRWIHGTMGVIIFHCQPGPSPRAYFQHSLCFIHQYKHSVQKSFTSVLGAGHQGCWTSQRSMIELEALKYIQRM